MNKDNLHWLAIEAVEKGQIPPWILFFVLTEATFKKVKRFIKEINNIGIARFKDKHSLEEF